jgi:hypothetical protein
MAYKPRIADAELAERLQSAGVVLIEGPKACGKTATGSRVALDTDLASRQLAGVDPSLLLQGSVPRLIDEWQVEPALWNHVRREIDTRRPEVGSTRCEIRRQRHRGRCPLPASAV